jgi:nicotinamidase-related amidase
VIDQKDVPMETALLVIDVQDSFRHRPYWRDEELPAFRERLLALIAGSRAKGVPIVHVLHQAPGSGGPFDPASGHVQPMDWLPSGPDAVFRKSVYSALVESGLREWLEARRIGRVIVSGARTEQCCETTARIAFDLGYHVTFAIDATTTTPIAHRDAPPNLTPDELMADPRTLSVDDVIERTAYALAGRFARIRTVDELTGVAERMPVG